MATKIYNPNDWKIYTYTPELGSFVLDFSQLNGPDVLGTSPGVRTLVDYQISNISIQEGGLPDSGMFLPIQPSIMQAEFIVKDFVTTDINNFYVGTSIQIIYDGYQNTNLTSNEMYVFTGFVSSASVQISPGQDFSTISITADASSRRALNSSMNIKRDETTLKGNLIQAAANANGISLAVDAGAYNFKGTNNESKPVGEWLSDLALCDLMQFTDDIKPAAAVLVGPGLVDLFFSGGAELRVKENLNTSVGTLDGSVLTDVQLDWSGSDSPTGVTLTNYQDSTIVYSFGSTVSDPGGTVAYSATVDLKDLTQMTTVGKKFLGMVKAFRPIAVSVGIARSYQNVEYNLSSVPIIGSPGNFAQFYAYPKNYLFIGDTVTIDLPDNGINSVDMLITGRTIEITPDTWTTTYNLWKGFTN
jgi:hypothetical protein